MAPICCGLVPHLQLALHPAPAGQPVVIMREERVLAASEEAGGGGGLPRPTRRQAGALCPGAGVLEADPAAAARRGGRAGRPAAQLARGGEPIPLTPWRPPAVTGARGQLGPPVEDREALLFIARALAGDLAAELGLRGAGARRVQARLRFDGGSVEER